MEICCNIRILLVYENKMAAEISGADTVMQGADGEYWSWWWQNYSYWYWMQSGYGWQQSHGNYDDQYRQWLEYFNSVSTQGNAHTITQPVTVQRTRLRLIGNALTLCVRNNWS